MSLSVRCRAWRPRQSSPPAIPAASTAIAAVTTIFRLRGQSTALSPAAPLQEASLRTQIETMRPGVWPLRIVFVPHWKYVDTARTFQLHVPPGYTSAMFTHLPSRTTFIDNDRYQGEGWLGYWLAHELGHLATNSAKEGDAERAAREYRNRLKLSLQAESH